MKKFSLAVLAIVLFGPINTWARPVLPDFTELVEKNGAAVVNISTRQENNDRERSRFPEELFRFLPERPDEAPRSSLGSGLIISSDGYILTSAHVIEGASEVTVGLTNREAYDAKVVGADTRSDVALLKIEAKDLPTLRIGKPSRLKVGEWVLAIGSPFGFDNTATAGIVSAKGRSLPNDTYIPFIQTDVPINPGNSGGPLFNMDGEVVGINAQIFSRTGGFMGLSFSVPIDLAMNVADQLKEFGRVRRGWLGVTIQNVTRDLARSFKMDKPYGALVADIMVDSPAAKSDLKVGDVIISFDKRPILRSSDLPPVVGRTTVGESVEVKILREGGQKTVQIAVGELPEGEQGPTPSTTTESVNDHTLGMTVRSFAPEELQERNLEAGVLVTRVASDSVADEAGVRPNDVLLQLAGEPVTNADRLQELIATNQGETVAALIQRGGNSSFIVLKVPSK
ncbi:MAG: DegQ family serine endoprotease [Gammaproteobacteria bacterium]|nr:DegQ family serine endoprotease [Gammaproteobacteria bacterium]